MAVFVLGVFAAAIMQFLAVGEDKQDSTAGVREVMKIIGVNVDQYDLPEASVPVEDEKADVDRTLIERQNKEKQNKSASSPAPDTNETVTTSTPANSSASARERTPNVLLIPIITRRPEPGDKRLRVDVPVDSYRPGYGYPSR